MKRCFPFLLLALSCKTTAERTRSVPLPVKPSSILGTAYDASTGEFTGMTCIDVRELSQADFEVIQARLAEPVIDREVTAEKAEQLFSSFQKSFYTPATGLRLSRPYETANRVAPGRADSLRLVSTLARNGTLRIRASGLEKLRLIPDAQRLVQAILGAHADAERAMQIQAFVAMCGSGFLSGTSYALGVAASLRWVFQTPEARQNWNAKLAARELDELVDNQRPPLGATLHFETYVKETRDVNLKKLGDVSARDCSETQHDPCIDAFRAFINIAIPAYQKQIKPMLRNSDLILPQAYLAQPEITRYALIEPALMNIRLEPDVEEIKAWEKTRAALVDLAAQAARLLQRALYMQAEDAKAEILALQQEISDRAGLCYPPQTELDKCREEAAHLAVNLESLRHRLSGSFIFD